MTNYLLFKFLLFIIGLSVFSPILGLSIFPPSLGTSYIFAQFGTFYIFVQFGTFYIFAQFGTFYIVNDTLCIIYIVALYNVNNTFLLQRHSSIAIFYI